MRSQWLTASSVGVLFLLSCGHAQQSDEPATGGTGGAGGNAGTVGAGAGGTGAMGAGMAGTGAGGAGMAGNGAGGAGAAGAGTGGGGPSMSTDAGRSCAQTGTCPDSAAPCPSGACGAKDAVISKVYFAQTHVLPPDDPLFRLVSNRDALIKVQVLSPSAGPAPEVSATLTRGKETLKLVLKGPAQLPTAFVSEKGMVKHRYDDSFTATIPAAWVQPGLSVAINAGVATLMLPKVTVGASTRVIMTMLDMHFFALTKGDYPTGWQDEIVTKWPASALELRRTPAVVLPQLVVPPRGNLPAVLCSKKQDYTDQTGMPFDGEQAAALQWSGALKAAAGLSGRYSLYFMNIYGAFAGGQAGNYGGVGNGGNLGILHHEIGHAFSLPHWGDSPEYPYKGDMFGITAPANYKGTHAGPTWAFDQMKGQFLPPTVAEGIANFTAGVYKMDPMQGGGVGDQERGYLFRHFSDYSVKKMQGYLENHVVVWNEALKSYASWNDAEGAYTKVVANNGVQLPIERDGSIISLMAVASQASPKVNLVYPPIGPYTAGRITLFDPRVAADRTSAAGIYCPPVDGCDVSLRFVQGGMTKVYMLPIPMKPGDPLAPGSLSTRAINIPAKDGPVTSVELLSTPDAQTAGLADNPPVLSSWKL